MNRADKIKLVLDKIDESKIVRDSSGTNDISKAINVNAIKNTQTNLWHLRYDAPATTPVPLQQQFTNFNKLIDFAEKYYGKRNLKIKEMKDIIDA